MEANPRPPAIASANGSSSLKKSPPLQTAELALVIVASAHLCFLAWALGGMHAWSQLTSFACSLVEITLALIPRNGSPDNTAASPRSRTQRGRLLRFPVFWLGLAIVIYATTQALNPAWEYVKAGDNWWMDPLDSLAWLPSSASVPFEQAGPWRASLGFASAWLFTCALWTGLTRRISIRALFTVLAINGASLAMIGLLQQVAGNGRVLWTIAPPATNFVSTFFYKNHAGAYFNLVLALTTAVGWWQFARAERRARRRSLAPLLAFCALLLALMITLSLSRAATLLMAIFLVICLVALTRWWIRQSGTGGRIAMVAGGVFLIFLAVGAAHFLNVDRAAGRMQELFTRDRAASIEARQLAARATLDMAREHLATGWGAGTFRYFFPNYQRAYPEIHHPSWAPNRMFFWEHAHNDYLEYLAELGLCGTALLAAILLCWLAAVVRQRVWRCAPAALAALGVLLLLAHSWIDFGLQCPAILFTAIAAAVSAIHLARMDSGNGRTAAK